jgi:hypothetical protein
LRDNFILGSVCDTKAHTIQSFDDQIDPLPMELAPLARIERRIQGQAQSINCGADIFLVDEASQYLGRICHYRECRPRMACRAIHCGLREHLSDDLHVVTLNPALIGAPPIELWTQIITRAAVTGDVEAHVLSELLRK